MNSENISRSYGHFISLLKTELEAEEVDAWVGQLKFVSFKPTLLCLGGLNQFFCNYVKRHHIDYLTKKAKEAFEPFSLSPDFSIHISSGQRLTEPVKKNQPNSDDPFQGLNPGYTFDSFVSGSNSDIAYAAAMSVGEHISANKYNPLFICGEVGLGKTHMIQAIGLSAIKEDSNFKVLYASSKDYINEVIEGIRFQKINQVRAKYRDTDLLLIDDIQFLENKESTQEEFFQLFNGLIQSGKQVVLTSDRYPREIKNIAERLISRFNSGMVAKIDPPDFETRVAIIEDKIQKIGLPLSEEITTHMAGAIKSNVRDIEGILIHIEANWSLLHQEITLDSVKRVLKEVMNVDSNPKNIENIIKRVAEKFDIKVSEIMSDKRTQEISKPRQIAMYISREATGQSFPAIAEHFGGKNHTTVIQAYKKTKEWIDKDPEIRQTVQTLLREISL